MVARVLLITVLVLLAVVEVIEGACTNEQFPCLSGYCIPRSQFCNGAYNCGDYSDYSYCTINVNVTKCPDKWFACASGTRCIPGRWRCDRRKDCPDGSDEVLCEVNFSFFPKFPAVIGNLFDKFTGTRKDIRSTNKWGDHLPRTAVALFLADKGFFAPGNETGDEISYELSLQMLSKLALKKNVSTHDLALFINAMTVSCIDPKDFFGVDLVAELRNRVDSSNFANPFLLLTLCNAGGSMTQTDVLKANSTFFTRLRPVWTDMQAFAAMATDCMLSRPDLNVDVKILKQMVAELKQKQHNNGTIGNLKTTALVLQALISSDKFLADFDVDKAIDFVLGELNNTSVTFHDMYYVLPLLNTNSLVHVNADHCKVPVKTELELLKNLREHHEERVEARISVYIGDEKDFVRNWVFKVPPKYTLYQVLETLGTIEPAYKVHYTVPEDGKPYVGGVLKFFNDAEDGMFWYIYTQDMKNDTGPKLLEQSPVDIPLCRWCDTMLWFKSEVLADG